MPEILEYNDYRAFMNDHFHEMKQSRSFYSYRYLSSKTGVNPGFLIRIMQGNAQLPVKKIDVFSDFYHFTDSRKEYWTELVLFGRARLDSEVYMRYERLQVIKGIQLESLKAGQLEYLSHWRHNAIRSLLGIISFKDEYAWLGKQLIPKCTAKDVLQSIQLLEKLNLIYKNQDGYYSVTNTHLTAGGLIQQQSVRDFQKQLIQLGIDSLESIPLQHRDISTVTLTVNLKELPLIKERIQAFRQELFRIADDSEKDDAVMQLDILLFPLAISQKGNNK